MLASAISRRQESSQEHMPTDTADCNTEDEGDDDDTLLTDTHHGTRSPPQDEMADFSETQPLWACVNSFSRDHNCTFVVCSRCYKIPKRSAKKQKKAGCAHKPQDLIMRADTQFFSKLYPHPKLPLVCQGHCCRGKKALAYRGNCLV